MKPSFAPISLVAAFPSILLGSASCNVSAQATESLASIEQVIVTAQKIEQPLQDVPLSVDVLRGEKLEVITSGAPDVLALAGRSPSLYAESSSGRTFPRFYLRGLGNTDFDLNASQPVSLVYDEIVLENAILKGFPIFDMERIEVVRGPQGTLFGRNTPAGVIKFESVRPGMQPDGYFRGSYGRFDTTDIEGAYGGPLVDDILAARVSFQYQQRDDFVNNTFTQAGENGFEEFDELAGRMQLLFAPREDFSALLNVHGRTLDGGSRLFRANIIRPGSGGLIPGFALRRTAQDATQILEVENFGVSLKAEFDFSFGVLTSVTGFEQVELVARGDVDGGFGADFAPPVGPGSIPFPAESADNITGHHQITQEIRLAFSPADDITSTVGVFLFLENLELENLSFDSLAGGQLNGKAIQDQDTTSWALFSANEWALTERLTAGGGLRVSGEDRDFVASRLLGPFGAPALGPIQRDLDDTVMSGDASVRYAFTSEVSAFARYARGFRSPAVQGRIVFGDVVTVAATETVDSVEVGLKSSALDSRWMFNATGYYFQTNDQQLTAVGGAGNFNQLLNADRVLGHGVEFEAALSPIERLQVTAGYSFNRTEIDDPALEVAVCAIGCALRDPINPLTGNARIDGNTLPQSPRHIANFTLRYGVPLLQGAGELYLFSDVVYRSEIDFFLYRSAEFRSDDLTEVGFRAGYIANAGQYELAAFGRNVFDQRSVNGGIDFNNFTGFVNEPATWGVEFIARF
ncbi:MAG: TonB-dependent receptor [Dehalococcoidia bacterium]